jgi:competence protein ComEA
MDRSAAPWRVLDSESPSPSGGTSAGPAAPVAPGIALTLAGAVAVVAIALAVFAAAASNSGVVTVERGGGQQISPGASAAGPGPSGRDAIVVDVAGAVLRPGVYRLPAGSRIGDAIDAAGGYDPRVDADRAADELNLASVISDGDRVRVPSRDDSPGTPAGDRGGAAEPGEAIGGLVNVNRASAAELEELPGIGPVTAGKIIAAREEEPFVAVDDLLSRKVVGNATMEKIRDLVTVR